MIGSTVFFRPRTSHKLRNYILVASNETHHFLYSEFNSLTFPAKKEDVFFSREEAKFQKFKEYVLTLKKEKRQKYLTTTKLKDFRQRLFNENPEYFIS